MVTNDALLERARAAAASVTDPELPPLTVDDLGILRDVRLDNGTIEVAITPTYSGCPAMREITVAIATAVRDTGVEKVRVKLVLRPAWTTGWLTEAGRGKLLDLGIAPPEPGRGSEALFAPSNVACPRCHSLTTERISAFGSTACKALHRFRCVRFSDCGLCGRDNKIRPGARFGRSCRHGGSARQILPPT